MEPAVTLKREEPFYLVYLFRGDGRECWLSLNQGTTEVYDRVGGRHYLQVLRDQAAVDAGFLGPLSLSSSSGSWTSERADASRRVTRRAT